MTFIRKIKKRNNIYLAEVQGYRENGKVKQRVIRYLGKEINGKAEKKVFKSDIKIDSVKRSLDILAVNKVAQDLKINSLKNKHILALIYSQVLEKYSINKLQEWLKFTEIPSLLSIDIDSLKELYESLGELQQEDVISLSEKLCEQFLEIENSKDVAVIDITDTYFTGSKEEIKTRRGKDKKVSKLIQIGLAVSFKYGFPLFHKKYHGNLNDSQIFKDMSLELKSRNLKGIILDRGMSNAGNIDLAKTLSMEIIAGLKKTKSINDKYLSSIDRQEIYSVKNRVVLKNTSVFAKSFDYKDGKLIAIYNPKLEVQKNEIRFEKGNTNRDVYIGYSLIYHNTKYSSEEVIRQYFNKDIVERAFKQMKGILNLRPIRLWLKEHVQSHIDICYFAYAILSYMNYKLIKNEITALKALESLKHGYKVTLKANNDFWSDYVPLEPKQKQILDTLGVVYKK